MKTTTSLENHSYSHHFFFDLFSSKKMLRELKMMNDNTEKLTGLKPKLFRPPYGVINPNLRKAILDGDYTPVGWSVRSMDTMIKNKKKLLGKIKRSLKPGAVFCSMTPVNPRMKSFLILSNM